MSSGTRAVVIDVNFFAWLHRIDADCELIDFIREAFGGHAVGEGPQLDRISYCTSAAASMHRHDATDSEVVAMMHARPDVDFPRVLDDPADGRLLVYAHRQGGVLLTCDTRVLMLAHRLGVEHWCFKAALWETDDAWGGEITACGDYATEAMEDPGPDPYFNRGCCKHCHKCDPNRQCRHGHVHGTSATPTLGPPTGDGSA